MFQPVKPYHGAIAPGSGSSDDVIAAENSSVTSMSVNMIRLCCVWISFAMTEDDAIGPQLMEILLKNNWHKALGPVLEQNELTFDELQALKGSEFEQLCSELNLTTIQTLKMRALMTEIRKTEALEGSMQIEEAKDSDLKNFLDNNQLPSNLYDALSAQGITYQTLKTIAPYDINTICSDYGIPIGVKIHFQSAVDKYQIEGFLQNETGSPVYIERVEKKQNDDYDHKMKIILLGDSAVGKTNLMTRCDLHHTHYHFSHDFAAVHSGPQICLSYVYGPPDFDDGR